MIPTSILGLLSAIASALTWGSADFIGGRASRRNPPLLVLALASLSGLLVLSTAVLLLRDPIPGPASIRWSALAGLSGGLGLAILYRALATGPAALVAPVAAVVGAALPVLFGFLTEGTPSGGQTTGLLVGLLGIWLVSSGSLGARGSSTKPLGLALAAGLAFGSYFILMARVDRGAILVPLAITRLMEFALAAGILAIQRPSFSLEDAGLFPFLAGVLDAGGTLFYLLAIQSIRVDLAAVVSSMYPGATVLLARMLQKEPVSRTQLLGIVVCLAAVAVIAIS